MKKILTAVLLAAALLTSWSGISQDCPKFTREPASILTCINNTNVGVTMEAAVSPSLPISWEVQTTPANTNTPAVWGPIATGIHDGAKWTPANTRLEIKDVEAAQISYFNHRQIRCKVTSTNTQCGANGVVYSRIADLTVNDKPSITPPSSRAVCEKSPLDMVVTASGGGPYQYKWRKGTDYNVVAINSPVFLLKEAKIEHGGTYTVSVDNACQSPQSASFTITIIKGEVPVVTTPIGRPVSSTVCGGNDASFKVIATGDIGSYKWEYAAPAASVAPGAQPPPTAWTSIATRVSTAGKFTVPNTGISNVGIRGYDSNELQFLAVPTALSGYKFRCVISAKCTGAIISPLPATTTPAEPEAVLTVSSFPQIQTPLLALTRICDTPTKDIVLSVTTTSPLGAGATYVWKKITAGSETILTPSVPPAIPSNFSLGITHTATETTITYTKTTAAASDSGRYELTIKNSCGEAKAATKVVVNRPNTPTIQGGGNICDFTGYAPIVTNTPPDNGPYTYNWFRNGSPIDPPQGTNTIICLNNPKARLLEVVPTEAKLAYSLRKLTDTGYNGYAVKVRRTPDNATEGIGFTPSGAIDVQAYKNFAGSGSVYVQTWYDQSPNGFDAVQTDHARQPELKLTDGKLIQGQPFTADDLEIKFDGDDFLEVYPKKINDLTTTSSNYGAVFAVIKSVNRDDNYAFGIQDGPASANWWCGNPLTSLGTNPGNYTAFSVANTDTKGKSAVGPNAWGQFTFNRTESDPPANQPSPHQTVFSNRGLGGPGPNPLQIELSVLPLPPPPPPPLPPLPPPGVSPTITLTFTLGKANGATHGKACSMKEFIMYPKGMEQRDKNSIEVSQGVYFQIFSTDLTVTGDLNLASDYIYHRKITATKFLDASCVPYFPGVEPTSGWQGRCDPNLSKKLEGNPLIRPWIPSDLVNVNVEIEWIDFTDLTTLIFAPLPSGVQISTSEFPVGRTPQELKVWAAAQPRPFKKAMGKSPQGYSYGYGATTGNYQHLYPSFVNGRLESRDSPKGMKSYHTIGTSAGWSFFGVAGYTEGPPNSPKKRIFDGGNATVVQQPGQPPPTFDNPDISFGFKEGQMGGIYWEGDPDASNRGIPPDEKMHVFSARQKLATDRSTAAMIQDWDNAPRQSWSQSAYLGQQMTINLGKNVNERTNNFAVNEIITVRGDLSDEDYEKIRAYIAWHAGLQANLPASHKYASSRPLITKGAPSPTNPNPPATITYRVKVGNACGTPEATAIVTTGSCTNAIILPNGQPKNQVVCTGGEAKFEVKAQNATGYNWQRRKIGATAWKSLREDEGEIGKLSSTVQAPGGGTMTMTTVDDVTIYNSLPGYFSPTPTPLLPSPIPFINPNETKGWITNGNYVMGTQFIVNEAMTITHIGAVVRIGKKLLPTIRMGIWDASGALIADVATTVSDQGDFFQAGHPLTDTESAISNARGYAIFYFPLPTPLPLEIGKKYIMGRRILYEDFLHVEAGAILEPSANFAGAITFEASYYRLNVPGGTLFDRPNHTYTSQDKAVWFTTMVKGVRGVSAQGPVLTIPNASQEYDYRCVVSGLPMVPVTPPTQPPTSNPTEIPSEPARLTINGSPLKKAFALDSLLKDKYDLCKGSVANLTFNLAKPVPPTPTTPTTPPAPPPPPPPAVRGGGPVTFVWTKTTIYESQSSTTTPDAEQRTKEVRRVTVNSFSDTYIEQGLTGMESVVTGSTTLPRKASYSYKVTASNACTPAVEASTLVSIAPSTPTITTQPVDIAACIDETKPNNSSNPYANPKMTVVYPAAGPPQEIKWETLNQNTGTWGPVPLTLGTVSVTPGTNTTNGVTTYTSDLQFTKPAALTYNKKQYRCSLKNSCGEIFTNSATIFVHTTDSPTITRQPTNLALCIEDPNSQPPSTKALGALVVEAHSVQGYRWVDVNTTTTPETESDVTDTPGVVAGARTNMLIFYPNATSLNNHTFKCKLTNGCVNPQTKPNPTTTLTAGAKLTINSGAPTWVTPAILGANNAGPQSPENYIICSGGLTPFISFQATNVTGYFWRSENQSETGLPANGNESSIASFSVNNYGKTEKIDAIRVIPVNGACVGAKKGPIGANDLTSTSGDVLANIVSPPVPTMSARFVSNQVCSSSNNIENIELKMTNQSNYVANTIFNWEIPSITEVDSPGQMPTSPNAPVIPSPLAASGSTAVSAGTTRNLVPIPSTRPFRGRLNSASKKTLAVTYDVYPSIQIAKGSANQTCEGLHQQVTIWVKPVPKVNAPLTDLPLSSSSSPKTAYCADVKPNPERIIIPSFRNPADDVPNTIFRWKNNNTAIGLEAEGNGDIDGFTALNATRDIITATIEITPMANGCTGSPKTFRIKTAPKPSVQIKKYPLAAVCSGSAIKIELISFPKDVAGTRFKWSVTAPTITGTATVPEGTGRAKLPVGNSIGWDIEGNLINASNKPEKVAYSITPTANGCDGVSASVTVNVNPVPRVGLASPNTRVCSKQSTSIVLNSFPASAPPVEGTFYTWEVSNPSTGATDQRIGVPGPIAQQLITPQGTTGIATVTYTITPQANGCSGATATATVTIDPLLTALPKVNKKIVCQGDPVDIDLLPPTLKFTWTLQRIAVSGGAEQTMPIDAKKIAQSFTPTAALDGSVIYSIYAASDKDCLSDKPAIVQVGIIHGPQVRNTIPDQLFCDNDKSSLQLVSQVESESTTFTTRWEVSKDNGASWQSLDEAAPYFGVNSNGLLINPVPATYSGYQYRLAVNDQTCPATHSSATKITAMFGASSAAASATQIDYGGKVEFTFNQPPPNTTYEWDFGDEWTSTLQNPEHIYYPPAPEGKDGPFPVTVDAYGYGFQCKRRFELPSITVVRAGIEGTGTQGGRDIITEIGDFGVSVYPSPFSDKLTVKSGKWIEGIALIDMRGSVVINKSISGSKEVSLQAGHLSSGIYILRIWNSKGEYRIKVTKE